MASAEFNKEIGAVEVNFNGYGESALYHETMDIAMNIAVIYDTNRWLFIKDFFQDINPIEFLLFVKKWSNTCNELLQPLAPEQNCQVALLTTPASERKLIAENEWLKRPTSKFSNLNIKIFSKLQEAKVYLMNKNEHPLEAIRD